MSSQPLDDPGIDALPRFSPWPARLLGLEPWQPRSKTPSEVTREFGTEKWGALLERYRATSPAPTIDVVEEWSLEGAPPALCSIGTCFEVLTLQDALARQRELIARTLQRLLPANALVELGAGYGGVILKLAADPRFAAMPIGAAEYTASGTELLRELAKSSNLAAQVGRCDLGKSPITELQIPPGSLLFTCMAAHYLPEIPDSFVAALCALRPKAVVHFEPCYEHCGVDSLLGLLRRRYIEVNDYNRNLVSMLHRHARAGDISIFEEAAAVIGVNSLLPISILAWRPAGSL